MKNKSFPKRGEIFWIELDPAFGAETQKKRPGLIVSNDIGNEFSKVVIIAPITSNVRNIYPFEVKISLNHRSAKIMLNQCRALDKSRILTKMGEVDLITMQAVTEAIKIVFAIS